MVKLPYTQSHAREPRLMDRQFNQVDPVPMVGKAVAVSPNAKAKANKNDRTYAVRNDCDNASEVRDSDDYTS